LVVGGGYVVLREVDGARPLTLVGDGMGSLQVTRSLVLYVILDAHCPIITRNTIAWRIILTRVRQA